MLKWICGKTYWAIAMATLAGAIVMLFAYTPVEATMGPIQKVFYVHLPAAINAFTACLVVCVASAGYLAQRKTAWDDLAASAAKVAVVLCSVVLLSGMVWGRFAWGKWWTWSPRLTFSLLLWLLYVVYLIIRSSIESSRQRATVAAVYGIVAFLDVPLVWLSVRLMPDIHPTSVTLAPEMKLTLAVWFVPVTLIMIGLVGLLYRHGRQKALWRQAMQAQADADWQAGPAGPN